MEVDESKGLGIILATQVAKQEKIGKQIENSLTKNEIANILNHTRKCEGYF